jgi:hypothetical protein
LNNFELIWNIQEMFLFPESLTPNIKKILTEQTSYIQNISLDKKETFKALWFIESESYKSPEEKQLRITQLITAINKKWYKQLSEKYKDEMNKGNNEAFTKYSQLVGLAKKHNIK